MEDEEERRQRQIVNVMENMSMSTPDVGLGRGWWPPPTTTRHERVDKLLWRVARYHHHGRQQPPPHHHLGEAKPKWSDCGHVCRCCAKVTANKTIITMTRAADPLWLSSGLSPLTLT